MSVDRVVRLLTALETEPLVESLEIVRPPALGSPPHLVENSICRTHDSCYRSQGRASSGHSVPVALRAFSLLPIGDVPATRGATKPYVVTIDLSVSYQSEMCLQRQNRT